jgi:hypothetical protein
MGFRWTRFNPLLDLGQGSSEDSHLATEAERDEVGVLPQRLKFANGADGLPEKVNNGSNRSNGSDDGASIRTVTGLSNQSKEMASAASRPHTTITTPVLSSSRLLGGATISAFMSNSTHVAPIR